MSPYYLCKFKILRTCVKGSNQKSQKLLQHVYLGRMIICAGNVQNVWCHQESHHFQWNAFELKLNILKKNHYF